MATEQQLPEEFRNRPAEASYQSLVQRLAEIRAAEAGSKQAVPPATIERSHAMPSHRAVVPLAEHHVDLPALRLPALREEWAHRRAKLHEENQRAANTQAALLRIVEQPQRPPSHRINLHWIQLRAASLISGLPRLLQSIRL